MMVVVDWSVFIALSILAIASVVGSWDAYSGEKTGWTIEHDSIPEQPTFILCFGLSSAVPTHFNPLYLGLDFKLSLLLDDKR